MGHDIQGNLGSISYARYGGLIDAAKVAAMRISVVGVGGAASLVINLARLGVGHLHLVDFDRLADANPATQAFGAHEVGRLKVDALAAEVAAINPSTRVCTSAVRYQELAAERDEVWSADLILAMTDDFGTQALINRHAIRYRKDTLFAAAYPQAAAVEITGTLQPPHPQGVGCHRCLTFSRYRAYARGFTLTGPIPSHIFQAEYVNALLGNLIVSRVTKGALWKQFATRPILISRIDPQYCSEPNQAFAAPPEFSLFTTVQWHSEAGEGFVCPDCQSTPESRGPGIYPRRYRRPRTCATNP